MAKMLINDSTLTAIADAIRAKGGTSAAMIPGEMAALIEAISTGVELPSWITDMEFATGSLSAEGSNLTVPTSRGKVPTYFLLGTKTRTATSQDTEVMVIAAKAFGSTASRVVYLNMNGATQTASYHSSISVSYADDVVTFTVAGTVRFGAGRTYYAMMWW